MAKNKRTLGIFILGIFSFFVACVSAHMLVTLLIKYNISREVVADRPFPVGPVTVLALYIISFFSSSMLLSYMNPWGYRIPLIVSLGFATWAIFFLNKYFYFTIALPYLIYFMFPSHRKLFDLKR